MLVCSTDLLPNRKPSEQIFVPYIFKKSKCTIRTNVQKIVTDVCLYLYSQETLLFKKADIMFAQSSHGLQGI